MKALYRHKKSGDIFAIETDDKGKVLSTSGPLLSKELNPKMLDYDDYWNTEIKAKIKDFVRISKDEYLEILRKTGFSSQTIQKHLFG
jgi:shikimate kinase